MPCCNCGCVTKDEERFAENTTLHGVGRLHGSKSWYRKLFWTLACLTAWGALISQITKVWMEYKEYKTVTSMSFGAETRSGAVDFPAVTICAFNRFNKTALEHDLGIPASETILLDYIGMSFETYKTPDITLEQVDLIHARYKLVTGRDWNMSEILNIAAKKNMDSFVHMCYFWPEYSDDPEDYDCNAYTEQFFSHSYTLYGDCLTFNHFSKNLTLKSTDTGDITGLTIELDITPDEIVPSPNTGIPVYGVRLFVHPRYSPPMEISSTGVNVRPGSYASVGIQPERYIYEKHPWGNCGEYDLNYIYQPRYTFDGCDLQCKVKYIRERCRCEPFSVSGMNDPTLGLRMCETYDIVNCTNQALSDYSFMDAKARSAACKLPVCQDACLSDSYQVTASSAMYPNPAMSVSPLTFGQNGSDNVLLDIHFKTVMLKLYEEKRATSDAQLISDIGGQLGLFIGASLLTLTEILEYALQKFIRVCDWLTGTKKRKPPSDETGKNGSVSQIELNNSVPYSWGSSTVGPEMVDAVPKSNI